MDKKIKRPINILLVEDNPADVRLTQEAFKMTSNLKDLFVVKDGVEAMSFLKPEGQKEKPIRPDLILLDLNLPRKSGREVLEEIKQDPKLRSIPVIILTTSTADDDVIKLYDLHANCYITKPVDIEDFINCFKLIEAFWFGVVRLPPPIDSE
jgi:two-component system, chemotaxis family, response regulator Rcp1